MTKTFELPQKLVEYLTEQMAEGSTITTTYNEDSVIFIVTYPDLESWVTVVEWADGQERFSLVNLNGEAFKRLPKIMKEVE